MINKKNFILPLHPHYQLQLLQHLLTFSCISLHQDLVHLENKLVPLLSYNFCVFYPCRQVNPLVPFPTR